MCVNIIMKCHLDCSFVCGVVVGGGDVDGKCTISIQFRCNACLLSRISSSIHLIRYLTPASCPFFSLSLFCLFFALMEYKMRVVKRKKAGEKKRNAGWNEKTMARNKHDINDMARESLFKAWIWRARVRQTYVKRQTKEKKTRWEEREKKKPNRISKGHNGNRLCVQNIFTVTPSIHI